MCTAPNIRRKSAPSFAPPVHSARFVFALFLGSVFCIGAPQLRAQSDDSSQSSQDVAEAARQERARKEQQSAKHVYTNEDLRRGKILTPEDQTRAAANRKKPSAPSTQPNAEPLDANSATPQEPLGDVARRYRDARRNSEKESPFHIPSQQPELAAPIAPAPKSAPKIFVPAKPSTAIRRGTIIPVPVTPSLPTRRVDPFSRRLLLAPPANSPVRPAEPRVAVQPNLPAASRPHAAPPAAIASVVVQPGDTLWALSRRHLGRGTRWLELMAANPNLPEASRLVPGTTLTLPPRTSASRALKAMQTITVHSGDTLSQLALATYGHASYWPCIARTNATLSNPHRLAVGQTLVLPGSCTP